MSMRVAQQVDNLASVTEPSVYIAYSTMPQFGSWNRASDVPAWAQRNKISYSSSIILSQSMNLVSGVATVVVNLEALSDEHLYSACCDSPLDKWGELTPVKWIGKAGEEECERESWTEHPLPRKLDIDNEDKYTCDKQMNVIIYNGWDSEDETQTENTLFVLFEEVLKDLYDQVQIYHGRNHYYFLDPVVTTPYTPHYMESWQDMLMDAGADFTLVEVNKSDAQIKLSKLDIANGKNIKPKVKPWSFECVSNATFNGAGKTCNTSRVPYADLVRKSWDFAQYKYYQQHEFSAYDPKFSYFMSHGGSTGDMRCFLSTIEKLPDFCRETCLKDLCNQPLLRRTNEQQEPEPTFLDHALFLKGWERYCAERLIGGKDKVAPMDPYFKRSSWAAGNTD